MSAPTVLFPGIGEKAAAYIERYGWTTGSEVNDEGQVCLEGAVRLCCPEPGDGAIARQVWRHWGASIFNDHSSTDLTKALAWARSHADITDADLEATFGPQWEHVVALIRRTHGLTEAESSRLSTDAAAVARAAARAAAAAYADEAAAAAANADAAAAYAYAAHAASYAASTSNAAAAYAAHAAHADEATYGHLVGARWAVRGLAIRHLIGHHGFTQSYYDTLTGPWRRIIGPVHPDDTSLEGDAPS